MRSKSLAIGTAPAFTIGPALFVLLLSSGCDGLPSFEVSGCGPIDVPTVNCRPYPRPVPVRRVPDGDLEFSADGSARLAAPEVEAVARANLDVLAHIRSAQVVGRHFAECIRVHNERVAELQAEIDERCGEPSPRGDGGE